MVASGTISKPAKSGFPASSNTQATVGQELIGLAEIVWAFYFLG